MHELEDNDYFEKEEEEQSPKAEGKLSDKLADEPADTEHHKKEESSAEKINGDSENPLLENIISSVDTITKIRNAVKSKSKEAEELEFNFKRSNSNASDRSSSPIKIQITLGKVEGNGSDSSHSKEEEHAAKRRDSEEMAEGDEILHVDPQKRVKLS